MMDSSKALGALSSSSHARAPHSNQINVQRPIRFVSNSEEPYAKRRRISAACRTCRRRKTRCSGEKPDCRTCLDAGQLCQGFHEQPRGSLTSSETAFRNKRQDLKASTNLNEQSDTVKSDFRCDSNDDALNSKQLSRSVDALKSVAPGVPDPTERVIYGDHVMSPKTVQYKRSPSRDRSPLTSTHGNRVPYFRYFGPTAIVPGFKQMVVEVNHEQGKLEVSPTHVVSKAWSGNPSVASASTASHDDNGSHRFADTPFYDRNDPRPVNPLIVHLCEVFFIHIGCNYPFLIRVHFMHDLQEKMVEAVLVDAICAIAARFSMDSMLTKSGRKSLNGDHVLDGQIHKSKHGQAFAHRAMSGITKTFACPSVAAVQACLLLAYEQFGSDHDSGLWMYLGISIRMAQDLGLQKLDGLSREGQMGPTPKTVNSGTPGNSESKARVDEYESSRSCADSDTEKAKEQRAVEKKRNDTFWAVFLLDRVISSGTGRPVTLRDKDIEIPFPSLEEVDPVTGWPAPFPALIRIIHLYGRVTDLLNNIQEVDHVNPDTLKRLAAIEDDLTGTYQGLSTKLHFSPANFQHYVKNSQGTNFVLLHFWFHTLIVLLHQPTLLHSYAGPIQQLLPNSKELSLSSAKTIADILTFAELIDSKSFVGNPFTSQPMYIAACAFLIESAAQTSSTSHSRATTPPFPPAELPTSPPDLGRPHPLADLAGGDNSKVEINKRTSSRKQIDSAKHTLLATAANRNYQRCYKALKSLETYWAGTKYILTVLDQKAKGVLDPLLYTSEDMNHAAGYCNPESSNKSQSWRHEIALERSSGPAAAGYLATFPQLKPTRTDQFEQENRSKLDPSHAFGWSLTGTTNCATPNLSFLYQTGSADRTKRPSHRPGPEPSEAVVSQSVTKTRSDLPLSQFGPGDTPVQVSDPVYRAHQEPENNQSETAIPSNYGSLANLPPVASQGYMPKKIRPITTADGELLHGLYSSYQSEPSYDNISPPYVDATYQPPNTGGNNFEHSSHREPPEAQVNFVNQSLGNIAPMESPYSDMIIESQNIDASALGEDMMLWLEHLPQDFQNY